MSVNTQIVTVTANVEQAPTPSGYQQSGALISVGATSALVTNSNTYYGTLPLLLDALGTTGNYIEVTAMATTFFAQNGPASSPIGVNVLELGNQSTPTAAITALQTWVTDNPNIDYAYLTPATWDSASSAAMNTMASNFSAPTSKTYFFGTCSEAHLSNYEPQNKALFMTTPSPTAAGTEFQAAVQFYNFLAQNPTPSKQLSQLAYKFGFAVTPWEQTPANQTVIDEIVTLFGNVIETGAEGGITTATCFNGTTIDGNPANFWWAVDWPQIQAKLVIANAIINASNDGSPIPFNQFGINQLLALIQQIETTGIASGIFLSATFSAIPFATWVAQNPGAYAIGQYGGFSLQVVPQLGFEKITVNITASNQP
jgi:hypothetical protein